MQKCKLFLTGCFMFSAGFLQAQDITGLWKGTLYNDSNRLTYHYEIAVSSEKNRLYGYSHTWFILDNKQYYGVKKLKVRKMKDKIITEDDGLIAHNYPVKPAKHVKQINILELNENDTVRILQGPFTTNRTKQYSPLTGYVKLQRTKQYQQTSLVPHLEELQLTQTLSFIEPLPEPVVPAVATIENKRPTQQNQKPVMTVTERTNQIQHETFYESDSLYLTLYDNGEVDGDSVSVYMNGVQLLHKVRLSTTPVTLTVSTQQASTILLVMYAESLGTIPPNTGLLIVRDKDKVHEIRFSSNLTENAAIVFKRKNN